jgi:serine/threonine-protein kinase
VGLRAQVSQEYSDTVPEGKVVSQNPKPQTLVPPGSAVQVVVSKGPAPVQVPYVQGKRLEEALRILSAAGLKAEVFGPKGAQWVLLQSPKPPTTVRRGSTVTLWVG